MDEKGKDEGLTLVYDTRESVWRSLRTAIAYRPLTAALHGKDAELVEGEASFVEQALRNSLGYLENDSLLKLLSAVLSVNDRVKYKLPEPKFEPHECDQFIGIGLCAAGETPNTLSVPRNIKLAIVNCWAFKSDGKGGFTFTLRTPIKHITESSVLRALHIAYESLGLESLTKLLGAMLVAEPGTSTLPVPSFDQKERDEFIRVGLLEAAESKDGRITKVAVRTQIRALILNGWTKEPDGKGGFTYTLHPTVTQARPVAAPPRQFPGSAASSPSTPT